ncbi:alpha-L-fucosidase [Streptomyces sp. NBC_00338]|uniref:alpha-L-fucosidase n=1 Tax=Streptomyces sp. NBC_00338 TaxID=2975715 RepID=UPI002251B079|nr:alpha-L-fucosidase [Streptomyces sp. NBC_00338]MCX5139817.1 alpha-L-fucosidase [Streptomyces sp. NBC_00338]
MRFARVRLAGALAALAVLSAGMTQATAAPAGKPPPPGSEMRNVALDTKPVQSSTYEGGTADRAVDGNVDGNWAGNSVSHTAQEEQPYWQTDLGKSQTLTKVAAWNRTDCCAERLTDFWVLVSDSPITARTLAEAKAQKGVTATKVAGTAGRTAEVPLHRKARYVRVQLEGTGYLALAEVQAFNDEVIASPSPAARKWVKDNPFGMFLHYNMSTYQDEQWADPNASPALFDPTDVDADQWAAAIKDAGMTFGVLTAKHHDGFALWDTAYSDHDIAASPYKDGKGDVIREYVDAMHAKHLKVGLYFSIWDRHNGDSVELIQNQLRELLTKYGQIDYLWFDGWGWQVPYSQVPYQPVRDMIRKVSPRTVVANNDHLGTLRTSDVIVYEVPVQGMPPETNARPTDASDTLDTNRTWFNTTATGAPRSASDITDNLARARAGNSLFLLNVGPDRTGRIPQDSVDRLKEIGSAS